MATSDHILRSSDCVAECAEGCEVCWYNRPFDPCYATNRYWKFEENSGTAFAFPMAALGVGSFDGIYMRRNVKFQLYSGADESNPFGPEMMGPRYISIDYWVTGNPACEGFDPGTFFVTGGAGALANYSMKIGGDTEIEELDLLRDENLEAHHTKGFTSDFVLRRDSTFEVELELGKEYGHGCHEVYFEAKHAFDGSETVLPIPPVDVPPAAGNWGAEFVSAETNGDETKKVRVRVHVPHNASIGKYEFTAFVRNRSTVEPTDEMEFDEPVYVFFNPWGTMDEVALANETERQEYVLAENGRMWRGSVGDTSSLGWRFDPFDENTLAVAMHLLEGASSSERAQARLVSRRFSKWVNVQDDNGVLVGRWSDTGDYSGGQVPWYWTGSDQIIALYAGSFDPVEYGQCWVFGGLLTSFLRCVGIPSRPLTNFNSAHEKGHPTSKRIDFYRNIAGEFDETVTVDSIWNYHVWCDAWIGAWSAVDATPQEPSGGFFQLGPAPHSAIKSDAGGLFDVDFVFTEVDADIHWWRELATGGYEFEGVNSTHVGRNITTKQVGGGGAIDITAAYKVPEASLLSPVEFGSNGLHVGTGLDVGFDPPSTTPLGDSLRFVAELTNTTADALVARVRMDLDSVVYDGTFVGDVDQILGDVPVAAGATEVVELIVPPAATLPWTQVSTFFEVLLSVELLGKATPQHVYVDSRRTEVLIPTPLLSIVGPSPVPVGAATMLRGEWTNPLSTPVTGLRFAFSVGSGVDLGGQQVVEVPLPDLQGGQTATLDQSVLGVEAGDHLAHLTVFADQFPFATTDLILRVFEDCNGNGLPDVDDVQSGASFDCNSNLVPDECEPDCDRDGIADDCNIAAEPEIDCNGNGVPDSCDVEDGTSPDINANGVPDGCDPDCNDNDVPDDYEIATGMASDFNGNGIPDACDFDCNGNGVSDELDISTGTSTDMNLNGVPDDCESGVGSLFPCFGMDRFLLHESVHALLAGGPLEVGSGFDPEVTDLMVEVVDESDGQTVVLAIPAGGWREWNWGGDEILEYEAPFEGPASYRLVLNLTQCRWRLDLSSGIDLHGMTGPDFTLRLAPNVGSGVSQTVTTTPDSAGWRTYLANVPGVCCN